MHTLTYEFSSSLFVESATIYNKPGSTARLEAYTFSVGNDLASLTVCASGGGVADVDVYMHACGLKGKYLRLSVDNTGDLPLNLREFVGVLRNSALSSPPPPPVVQVSLFSMNLHISYLFR